MTCAVLVGIQTVCPYEDDDIEIGIICSSDGILYGQVFYVNTLQYVICRKSET